MSATLDDWQRGLSCADLPSLTESASLMEIAILLDEIAEARREADLTADVDEVDIRRELFTLLDNPCQEIWERVREIELYPGHFPGLDTPSPLGITVGDLAYNYGLDDSKCPKLTEIIDLLRWGITEHRDPTDSALRLPPHLLAF